MADAAPKPVPAPTLALAREVNRKPRVLSRDEERALAEGLPDVACRNALVVANVGLCYATALKFRGRGVDLVDLVQEGTLGVMRATETYDAERGLRFATYASWWIRANITRAVDNARKRASAPVWGDVVDERRGTRPLYPVASLDAVRDHDDGDGSRTLADAVGDPAVDVAGDVLDGIERERGVAAACSALGRAIEADARPEVAREVIRARWGSDEPEGYQGIAARVGLSREGVRLIERRTRERARAIA